MKTRRFFVSFAILFVVLFLFHNVAFAGMVAIRGDNVNMRSGPGLNHSVIWKLDNGFPLEVINRQDEWLNVRDFEGSTGWVSSRVTNSVPHMIVKTRQGSNQPINIRSGPGLENRIVAKAHHGVVFKTLEKKNDWVKVEHSQGVVGWVAGRLLWGF
jgi:SH3-like domain-containing protein